MPWPGDRRETVSIALQSGHTRYTLRQRTRTAIDQRLVNRQPVR